MLPLKLTSNRVPQVIPDVVLHSKESKLIFPIFTSENLTIATAISQEIHLKHTQTFWISLKYEYDHRVIFQTCQRSFILERQYSHKS